MFVMNICLPKPQNFLGLRPRTPANAYYTGETTVSPPAAARKFCEFKIYKFFIFIIFKQTDVIVPSSLRSSSSLIFIFPYCVTLLLSGEWPANEISGWPLSRRMKFTDCMYVPWVSLLFQNVKGPGGPKMANQNFRLQRQM